MLKSVLEIRSILRMAEYYRRFVYDFAKITSLLTKLIRKGVGYVWTEECEIVFEELKWRLTITPTLAIPNNSEGMKI